MANTDQAQADQTSPETVADPLGAANSPENGTNDLASYEAEVAALDVSKLPGDTEEEEADETQPAEEEETDPEQTEETEETVSDETSEDDDSEEAPANTSGRYRVRAKDDLEAEALAMRKRHPDWSLKDCLAKAEAVLGKPAAPEDQQDETPTETVASVTAQIEELRRKRKEATAEMEFETAADLADQLDDLRDKRELLRATETQAQAEHESRQQQAHNDAFEQSKRKTVTFYPEASKPDHPLVKRMLELDAEWRENDDPLYHHPDKPWLLAQRAAYALGIPRTNPAKPPVKVPARSSKSPIQPAPGNRGTSSTDSTQRFETAMAGLDTLEDYERLVGRG